MKSYIICFLIAVLIVDIVKINAAPQPFLDKLFGGYDYSNSYGYENSYGGYNSRPRSYGRSYGYNEGGGDRYKSICRTHAVNSLAFPGRVGNPVCPY